MNHPTNDQGLLQEIEEDLHRQKFEALWKKFGPSILGLAAAIVLITALITGWQSYQLRTAQKKTAALWAVIDKEHTSEDDRRAAFETYAKGHGGTVQGLLASFYAAGIEAKKGGIEKAIAAYDVIAADKTAEPLFRDLATVLAVQTELDSGDAAKLESKLMPLIEKKSVWAPLAAEYVGHLALREGDKAKAKDYFLKVVAMENAPEYLVQRCAVMVEWIDGGE